jgi:hypothetical protein
VGRLGWVNWVNLNLIWLGGGWWVNLVVGW